MAKVQLTGGNFQYPDGTVLANGYFTMQLSTDAEVPSTIQIGSGRTVKILLDASGNVNPSPAQLVWPNDQLNPTNTYYVVNVYSSEGQLIWGPQYVQVTSTNPFDVGTWVPFSPQGDGGGPIAVQFETNGVLNSNQSLLNLQQGTGVTLSETDGTVTVSASGSSGYNPLSPASTIAYNDYFTQNVSSYTFTGEIWRTGSGTYTPPDVTVSGWASNPPINYPPPHVGVIRMLTTATINTGVSMDVSGGTNSIALNGSVKTWPYIVPNLYTQPWQFTYIFNLVSSPSNMKFAVGFRDGYFSYPNPYNGLQIGFDTTAGDTNWTVRSFANAGAAVVRLTTSVPVATGWHNITVSGGSSNSINWLIDGLSVGTTLSDYSYQNYNQHPFITVFTTDSLAKIVDLDYFSLGYSNLVR